MDPVYSSTFFSLKIKMRFKSTADKMQSIHTHTHPKSLIYKLGI